MNEQTNPEQSDSAAVVEFPNSETMRGMRRPLRRYRLDVEIVLRADWEDAQDKVYALVDECWPGAAVTVDLRDEAVLIEGEGSSS